MQNSPIFLIGYSGHAFVAADCLISAKLNVSGYFDSKKKSLNPYQLQYYGQENTDAALTLLKENACFISIGNNRIRDKVYYSLQEKSIENFVNAIHASAVISPNAKLGKGILVSANAVINSLALIGTGVICNTGSIIEHECKIGNFAHIAPGAVLAGNVTVGERTFIGANSVVKQGITIGKDVTVGAGTVIIKDIPDGATVVGNPGRIIRQ
jgi:sugar O-acyltransferase (sialic acid O-acetyltransferase NeuD family)